MSSKKINNVVWSCVPLKKNSIEGFSNTKTHTIECGLPYIRASRNSDDSQIEIFNKMALYIYIREITDTSTPHITKVTKKLDTLRTRLYNEYYKHGYIKI
jgi:hypothetical protein